MKKILFLLLLASSVASAQWRPFYGKKQFDSVKIGAQVITPTRIAGWDASSGGASPVSSVFNRTGSITAQEGDYAAFYPKMNGINLDANTLSVSGFYQCTGNVPNGDGAADKSIIHNQWGGGAGYATQIAQSWLTGRMWVRNKEAGVWEAWVEVVGGGSDPDAVKLTGNQTIAGIKTFTSTPEISGATPTLRFMTGGVQIGAINTHTSVFNFARPSTAQFTLSNGVGNDLLIYQTASGGGNSQWQLPYYGKGIFTGTPAYYAAWDGDGNLIEAPAPTSSSAKETVTLIQGDYTALLSDHNIIFDGTSLSTLTLPTGPSWDGKVLWVSNSSGANNAGNAAGLMLSPSAYNGTMYTIATVANQGATKLVYKHSAGRWYQIARSANQ